MDYSQRITKSTRRKLNAEKARREQKTDRNVSRKQLIDEYIHKALPDD